MLRKLILTAGIVLTYLFGIRGIREFFSFKGILFLKSINPQNENLLIYHKKTSLFVESLTNTSSWGIKSPFGIFFLISFLGLIFINARWAAFLTLSGIHLISIVLIFLMLILGLFFSNYFFQVSDFFSRYLIMLLSFGYVCYEFSIKKNETDAG